MGSSLYMVNTLEDTVKLNNFGNRSAKQIDIIL